MAIDFGFTLYMCYQCLSVEHGLEMITLSHARTTLIFIAFIVVHYFAEILLLNTHFGNLYHLPESCIYVFINIYIVKTVFCRFHCRDKLVWRRY